MLKYVGAVHASEALADSGGLASAKPPGSDRGFVMPLYTS
jgi:hypothetical protein